MYDVCFQMRRLYMYALDKNLVLWQCRIFHGEMTSTEYGSHFRDSIIGSTAVLLTTLAITLFLLLNTQGTLILCARLSKIQLGACL